MSAAPVDRHSGNHVFGGRKARCAEAAIIANHCTTASPPQSALALFPSRPLPALDSLISQCFGFDSRSSARMRHLTVSLVPDLLTNAVHRAERNQSQLKTPFISNSKHQSTTLIHWPRTNVVQRRMKASKASPLSAAPAAVGSLGSTRAPPHSLTPLSKPSNSQTTL